MSEWVSVKSSLPESGEPVLVASDHKVLRAVYAAKFTLDEGDYGFFNDGDGADYCEVRDKTYWPEGWYEWNEHEELHWAVAPEPTHWMPLPEPPDFCPALDQRNDDE